MKIVLHSDRKIGRVSNFNCQTKSAPDKNFSAAASSRKPINAFTETSQPPDFGSFASHCGNSASRKNGEANAAPNTIMPSVGQSAPLRAVVASNVPPNTTVQV